MFVPILLVRELRPGKGKGPGEGHVRTQAKHNQSLSSLLLCDIMALRPSCVLGVFVPLWRNEMWLRDPGGPSYFWGVARCLCFGEGWGFQAPGRHLVIWRRI